MNRKGFTIIEVILVIIIMSLLLLFLAPNVFVLLNKNNVKACNNLVDNIENAAKIYVINNKYQLGFKCPVSDSKSVINMEIKTLVDSGDLKLDSTGKMINPITKKEIKLNDKTDDVNVTVTYNCNNKTFTYNVNGVACTK